MIWFASSTLGYVLLPGLLIRLLLGWAEHLPEGWTKRLAPARQARSSGVTDTETGRSRTNQAAMTARIAPSCRRLERTTFGRSVRSASRPRRTPTPSNLSI